MPTTPAQAAIEEMERRQRARLAFKPYIEYVCPFYQFNWHHRLLAEILDRWAFGDIQRLMIFTPPRHGKTEQVSKLLPPYIFGRNPDAEVMVCSYSDTLASEANADCQKYIDSPAYQRLFPNTRLAGRAGRTESGTWLRNNQEFQIVNHRGRMRTAPIGGQITGKGFTHGIIDDPFKSRKDADSFARRQEVDGWYQSTFRSRKQTDRARELMILTRWHESDLAGRIIKRMRETPLADQWAIIKLPALRTEEPCVYDPRPFGATLWPSRHSLASVQATKATIDAYEWASVYQQEPAPRGGSIIMEHWLNPVLIKWRFGRQFFVIGADAQGNGGKWYAFERCAWFQTIDTAQTAKTTSDFTVVSTFALLPNGHLVIWHVFRGRLTVPQQFPAIVRLSRGMPPRPFSAYGGNFDVWKTVPFTPWPRKLTLQAIEPKSSGLGLIDQGVAMGLPLRALDVDGEKVRRAGPISVMASRGMVHYNPAAKGDWLEEFMAEVTAAPNSANDDQFDTLAYAGQLALYDEIIRAGVVELDSPNDYATGSEPERRDSYTVELPGGALELPDNQ